MGNTYQSLTVYNFNPRKFDCDVFVSLALNLLLAKRKCFCRLCSNYWLVSLVCCFVRVLMHIHRVLKYGIARWSWNFGVFLFLLNVFAPSRKSNVCPDSRQKKCSLSAFLWAQANSFNTYLTSYLQKFLFYFTCALVVIAVAVVVVSSRECCYCDCLDKLQSFYLIHIRIQPLTCNGKIDQATAVEFRVYRNIHRSRKKTKDKERLAENFFEKGRRQVGKCVNVRYTFGIRIQRKSKAHKFLARWLQNENECSTHKRGHVHTGTSM